MQILGLKSVLYWKFSNILNLISISNDDSICCLKSISNLNGLLQINNPSLIKNFLILVYSTLSWYLFSDTKLGDNTKQCKFFIL